MDDQPAVWVVEDHHAIVFREGDMWVCQCLEHDIGAQALDSDDLRRLIGLTIQAEREASMSRTGRPFGDIHAAPQRFWDSANEIDREALRGVVAASYGAR